MEGIIMRFGRAWSGEYTSDDGRYTIVKIGRRWHLMERSTRRAQPVNEWVFPTLRAALAYVGGI
jgi:hypothetical protein